MAQEKRPSTLYLLADVLVRQAEGVSLHEWMLAGRTRVDRLSWPGMSAELARLTRGRVTASTVTLRAWFTADLDREPADRPRRDERSPR